MRERERDSAIGVVLAFGLGLGVLLLGYYHGNATAATNILFGNIFGVSNDQLLLLVVIGLVVIVAMLVLFRPLLFASVDPEWRSHAAFRVRTARDRVPVRARVHRHRGRADRRHAARAQPGHHAGGRRAALVREPVRGHRALDRVRARCVRSVACSPGLASSTVKPSVFVTSFSFGLYAVSRIVSAIRSRTPAAA